MWWSFAPRLMAVQLDDSGGRLLRRKIEALGVSVQRFQADEGNRKRRRMSPQLLFADGTALETTSPCFRGHSYARSARAGSRAFDRRRGGIVVNDRCQTSDPDIYALGECDAVERPHLRPLFAPGYQMAEVARGSGGRGRRHFLGEDMSTKAQAHWVST